LPDTLSTQGTPSLYHHPFSKAQLVIPAVHSKVSQSPSKKAQKDENVEKTRPKKVCMYFDEAIHNQFLIYIDAGAAAR
jgi:hypothetical protein